MQDNPSSSSSSSSLMQQQQQPQIASGEVKTSVVQGVTDVVKIGLQVIGGVRNELCVYADKNAPTLNFKVATYDYAYRSLRDKGVRVRFITQIEPDNAEYCRRMIAEHGIELRHTPHKVMGYFSVADKREFMASSKVGEDSLSQILYSNSPDLCVQYQNLFESLWSTAIPAMQRILQIEQGMEPLQTKVMSDPQEASEVVGYLLRRAATRPNPRSFLYALTAVENANRAQSFLKGIAELMRANPDFENRYIADIQPENLDSVKSFVRAGVKVRHLEGNKIEFLVSQYDYLNFHNWPGGSPSGTGNGPEHMQGLEVLWSNNPDLVVQMQQLFSRLWDRAIPAEDRMVELESGKHPRRTEIVHGPEEVAQVIAGVCSKARKCLDSVAGPATPLHTMTVDYTRSAYENMKRRGVRIRAIVPINGENAKYYKELLETGLLSELRHLEGIKGDFAVSESEYIAASNVKASTPVQEMIYSNDPELVTQNQNIFETLWASAMPADLRFKLLEEGTEGLGETRVTYSNDDIYGSANNFVEEAKEEALILVPFEGSTAGNLEFFERVVEKANTTKSIRVKILGRFSREERILIEEFRKVLAVEIRTLASERVTNLSLGIYDRKGMVMVQVVYPDTSSKILSGRRYLSGVISTNKQVVDGMAVIFDSLWEESELREKEEKNRRTAELLQDILAHDLRNYNQIVKANAELLQMEDRITSTSEDQEMLDAISRAVDQSTALIDRAKRLGRILTQEDVRLFVVDLEASLQRALTVVQGAYPEKTVRVNGLPFGNSRLGGRPVVIADDLLDEVFTNVLSNAVRYTEGPSVNIDVGLEDASSAVGERCESMTHMNHGYWKVSIGDSGRGVPDEMKETVFTRYLRTAHGSGLGLSIVRALVADRYLGKVRLRNRVEGNFRKGTVVELWLPKASIG